MRHRGRGSLARFAVLLLAAGLTCGLTACDELDETDSPSVGAEAIPGDQPAQGAHQGAKATKASKKTGKPADNKTAKKTGANTSKKANKKASKRKPKTVDPGTTPSNSAGLGLVPSSTTALTALDSLTVKGKAAMTGYDRGAYGPAWKDVDRNGCDTRNDVLDRDLTAKTYRAGTHFCIVTSGRITSPYTGSTIDFVRGNITSMEVQIDHVVALANTWVSGAQRWDTKKRERVANDPLNLLAVDGSSNQSKGANDASGWLPAKKSFRCTYVALQISVKAEYQLSVTPAERDAMARVLATCPKQTTFTTHPVPAKAKTGDTTEPALPALPAGETGKAGSNGAKKKASATTGSTKGTGTDPRFASCREALEHGYGGYVDGVDIEYDWYRDGDKDGIVCE